MLISFHPVIQAQTISPRAVSEIITDFNGFWQSSSTAISTIKPNNSHNLLAFTYNNTRYSTAVNNALLTSRGLTYTKGNYQALSGITLSGIITTNTKVGVGAMYDGVAVGPSNPPPVRDLPLYLSDGINGLNIGTGIANVPAGPNLNFNMDNIIPSAVGDGIPDIIVTQIADPTSSADKYQFLNSSNVRVGNQVTILFTDIPVTGQWIADFYEASNNPLTLTSSFTNTQRDIRVWAADFSDFGITQTTVANVKTFQITLSGNSDVAFVAYNVNAFKYPLPVELTSFSSKSINNQVLLTWQTRSEHNSAYFEIETSTDGIKFTPIAQVKASGTTSSSQQYEYLHQTPFIGTNYYRLRQVDFDGAQNYSAIIAEKITQKHFTTWQIQVAPNPFKNKIELQIAPPEPGNGNAQIQLFSLNGHKLYEKSISGIFQPATIPLNDLPTLPSGIYLLKCSLNNHSTVVKVIRE
ncbi:T9SS type A sorting domain-containing protein [Adhaeribacter radiodurans]|uniref:T9SS type A sorting domain-containing protein n=1 Tax=Adhaeribacter radiodurans TaxID=2745197 RepID=A0A7L7LEG6_9BACT|nr:T9SS type A sorting domain-containing protein [Adhaeribacter radiodurans]QMU31147.1 T9SS type A sorting domain-containing protein [Adhaeribacter radiodurans]